MNYLEQLTHSDAHKVVAGFSHLTGDKAYKAAMKQLEDRYGDEDVIASAFIQKALNWPPVRAGDAKALDEFALFLVECDNGMSNDSNGVLEYSENIKKLMFKLPYHLHDRWRTNVLKLKDAKKRVKFQDFVHFVKVEAKKINDPTYGSLAIAAQKVADKSLQRIAGNKKLGPLSNAVSDVDVGTTKTENDSKCSFCDLNSHMSKNCRNRSTCNVCGKRHPSILHDDSKKPPDPNRSQDSEQSTEKQREVSNATSGYSLAADDQIVAGDVSCAMAIIPVKVKLRNKPHGIVTYAFLDTGSSASFCTETIMRQLGGHGKKTQLTLSTMGEPYTMTSYSVSGLQVCDMNMNNCVELPKVFTKQEMPVKKNHIPTQTEVSKWKHLSEISLLEPNVEIGLMLGSNVPDAYAPIKILTGPSGSPHGTKTKLGWVVWNILRDSSSIDVNRVHVQNETGECIEELVKRSMNLDFPERLIDDKREGSMEDKSFLKQVEQSIEQIGGQYCIALPFRNNTVTLPDNSVMARKRLRGIKNKFKTESKFKEEYTDFMETLLEKGYAEPAPMEIREGKTWYIPHHGVYHKKKGKLRVVFDCSAQYQGVTLNDNLLQGPDLTNNLLGVLMRFREEPIVVLGDIEAMFYQVKVPESERDYLRFYWWKDGNIENEPTSYRMTVHLFGATSSPSVCNFALQRTVEYNKEQFAQEVQDMIKRNMYVDDCLASVATEEIAVSLVQEVTQLCKAGGFRLTKWMSNSPTVIDCIPEGDRAKEVKLWSLDNEPPIERALGVYWYVENDSLGFQIQIRDRSGTRRGILSVTSSVYDPLGIASPFILKAKSVLQRLCKEGKGWDDLKNWTDWLSELPKLEHVTIDRCYKDSSFGKVVSCQLHGFADASDVGYGMVIYIRLVDETGKIHCSFTLGKARVAPLKTVTIPRMELTAAASLVRLCKMTTEQLNYSIDKVFYWTDSTSVLRYIGNKSLRLHTFTANRIALIYEATKEEQWHYVNTKQNPADCASRGMKFSQFTQNSIWFNGPDFLWKSESEWPLVQNDYSLVENDPEVKKTVYTASSVSDSTQCDGIEKMLAYFSDWWKLKRATAWLLTAKDNLRKAAEKTRQIKKSISCSESDPIVRDKRIEIAVSKERQDRLRRGPHLLKTSRLCLKVLEKAEAALIRHEQQLYFAEEIKTLDSVDQPKLKRSSKLYKLDPFMKDNLLHVGGRLERAELPYNAKHPLVLPKESKVSSLLMDDAHKSCGHLGRNSVLAFLRQKYWIIGARTILKSLLSKCVTCRKYRAPCSKQKMSNLPSERLLADEPPFSRIGMDFFGPLKLKRGRSIVKRYGVLFTCLVSRAVHLEVAASLDTDSCINAIRRFIARRGKPLFIRSDNGTNLVGAQREMKEEIQKWNRDKLHGTMLQSGINWEFNPPAASHFGGVWERLIRSVRQVLYSLMREQSVKMDDEGLQTLFCEVESILNGHPLTEASDSVNDLEVLTPNHLLLLRPGEWFPPGTFVKTDNYARRRWRQIQYLADIFWKRWTKEYLPLLQSRQKWVKRERNMKIGDLVLIADNSPRNSWPIGRIQDVVKDKHDIVRFTKVKTASNVLTRPIDKLVLILESDIED